MGFKKGHKTFAGTENTQFKKGSVPWNYGNKWSEETKLKMSLAKKGKPSWNKGKKAPQISIAKMGEKNPSWNGGKPKCLDCNVLLSGYSQKYCRKHAQLGSRGPRWKGGLTPIFKIIRHSFEYKEWRKNIFERDDYVCQKCNKRGSELHAHHIKCFADYPGLRFDLNNGETLCVECHKKTPNYGHKGRFGRKGVVLYGAV